MAPRPEHPRSIHTAEGGVILDIDNGRMFSLNSSGSVIFQLLEQGASKDRIIDELVKRFDIPADVAAADLADFCTSLKNYALSPVR